MVDVTMRDEQNIDLTQGRKVGFDGRRRFRATGEPGVDDNGFAFRRCDAKTCLSQPQQFRLSAAGNGFFLSGCAASTQSQHRKTRHQHGLS